MSTDTRPPPAHRNNGTLVPGRQSLNPSGHSKWVNEFQRVFREHLANPSKDVLEKVMNRALDTSDIDGVIAKVDVTENPNLFARLESEKNERYNQAIRAADVAMKYILPKPKEVDKPDGEAEKAVSKLGGLSTAELLALSRKPQTPKE